MNLVDLVKNQIGGDMIGRISNLLGVGNSEARSAVDAGVPALLAGLSGLASTNDGAKKLASTVNGLDDSMLSNIGNALAGGGANSVIDTGRNLLGSLFGNNMLSGLGGALSRFTGLGGSAVTSLLGLLAPMVLGSLKSQKDRAGLDAGGLANLLSGQKNNIMAAMPSGLGSMLSNVPGLSSLSGLVDSAGDTARDVAGSVYNTGRQVAQTATSTTRAAASTAASPLRWLLPVAAMLALVGLVWWAANRSGPEAVKATPQPRAVTPPTVNPTPLVDEQVTRLTDQARDYFSTATTELGKITDRASAEAALPRLREFATRLDSLRTSVGTLPAASRDKIASFINSSAPSLRSTIDKLMANTEVSEVLRPVADQIRNSITAFTKP